jgi:hypothetical protein
VKPIFERTGEFHKTKPLSAWIASDIFGLQVRDQLSATVSATVFR